MNYRPEIDGLRALAIIPVILFHAGFNGFNGGFVGVDVFFVISGYLITSIILQEHQSQSFSFINFYERRARRILPALFFMMFCTIPFAWFLMLPEEFKDYSQSLAAVPLFISNVVFWLQSGYFDGATELKPLLHTWSLAVEEQYYVVFPIIIAIFYRFGHTFLISLILLITVSSLLLADSSWQTNPTMNFYLLPTRAWEIMLGALTAFYLIKKDIPNLKKINQLASSLGLFLIIYSVIYFDKNTPFPSFYSIIPTLGTVLIILFGTPNTLIGKVLTLPGIIKIGLLSYSAYLWHQPLFAFARIYTLEEPSHLTFILLIAISFILAYFSWRFIETPFRNKKRFTRKIIFTFSIIFSLLFILLGHIFYHGIIQRYSQSTLQQFQLDGVKTEDYLQKESTKHNVKQFSTENKRKVLMIGDSYAQDFFNISREASWFDKDEVVFIGIPVVCQVVLVKEDVSRFIQPKHQQYCIDNGGIKSALSLINNADIIFIANSWKKWAVERLPETIKNLHLRNQKLYIVGSKSFPNLHHSYLHLTTEELLKIKKIAPEYLQKTNQQLELTLNENSIAFINLYHIICGNEYNCPLFTPNGEIISHDSGHLTPPGAAFIGKLIDNNWIF